MLTDNFLRPFARLALNTFLPFAEAIRFLKPCLFRRLRTEGWNVLFIMRQFLNRILSQIQDGKDKHRMRASK